MFQFDLGQIGTLTPSPCSTNQPRPFCTRLTGESDSVSKLSCLASDLGVSD
ncbi:MAG: hypothetical protein FWE41_07290 [Coriobacteriia bacterium]|nr:hypothetical protein [Coriobacteriia bacterium]MCL2749980.1 hypothetical protein [Coriobacteriia bacterium]